ncbi:DMT family transporter [Pseudoalteromonas sp. JBTF-M23]|uniref:DMT family transporter n=1 Tax=Pseudoalteromonas caenipelagi TaxID=2726988 RepID=A0A849VIW1_9GAMM|nr:DMT family transporter [Pseudoalteromonas caenipelagi]NOU52403.1 DMT family transporter [Pseudoalteromonas caenipelagi]
MTTYTQAERSSDSPLIITLVLAMLLWGASWISGKLIASLAPAPVTVFYRLAMATIGMLPILWLVNHFKLVTLRFSKKALLWSLPAGVILAFYNQLFFLGLHDGLPGKGGMLVTTTNPVFTFLLATILFKQKVAKRQMLGLALGLAGGMCMIQVWQFDYAQLIATGNAYFIMAALTWAVLTLVSQQGTRFADFLLFSTLMYASATAVSYGFAYEYSPLSSITQYSSFYWQHMLFLSVVVVSIATSLFFLANQQLGSSRSSSFIFVVPASAMGLSAWYFSEPLSLPVACGAILAIFAVYLINNKIIK